MSIASLQRAEREFEGGRAAFAAALGVSASTVGMWHVRNNIPTNYLKPIEVVMGGRVTVYQLLEDIEAAAHPDRVPAEPSPERAA